ncbi:DNA mismatch repair endonuclease MutL [Ihubacter sp. mB4P-1]|uniref:DNA mismatch repair endonuclease MutL n=1 Tax=Ihubacter sp. mB4P-1 TaxID=3242370 RepID=UPI00137AFC6F
MIKVLDKQIADKIAAGEVIERPVSIVKELTENAVDAGASSITVEIKNGGKSYIRITDDGCGIPSDQAETAFLRHATSKIEKVKDLDAIHTLGFRGEALASIAAVTHTELITKTKGEKVGTRLLIHGGEILANEGMGCPDGTTIVVTDLFYNTPARRKFLKSDGAESGQIIDFVAQLALAYPNIRFRFINNGSHLFSTAGKGDLHAAILAVYQLSEYRDLVPVDYTESETSVHGFISRPSLTKTTRKSQIFFVNGRVISSKIIEKGVMEGYRERIFEGRHPVVFLFVNTDPARLDVNIHPNKKEVRFDNEKEIIEIVAKGISQALGTKAAVTEVKKVFSASSEKSTSSQKEEQIDIKQILSTKRRPIPAVAEKAPETFSAEASAMSEERAPYIVEMTAVKTKALLSLESPRQKPFDFADLYITGVIFDTYITATDEGSFYLIDQHAAHERVFYEKLVGEYLSEEKLRQPILTPIIIEVPFDVKENEYNWLDSLTDMGFSIEEFGQNSYIIREIPTFMSLSEAEDFAKIFIENLSEGTQLSNTVVINKLITKSCKSAVKAHDKLSATEMQSLINQLAACKNPFSCPHGRPTFIRMTKYEIERMFKRV